MAGIQKRVNSTTIPVRISFSTGSKMTVGEYNPLTSLMWILVPSDNIPDLQMAALGHEFYSHPLYFRYRYRDTLFTALFTTNDSDFQATQKAITHDAERAALVYLYFNNRAAYRITRKNLVNCYPEGKDIIHEATLLIAILESLIELSTPARRREIQSSYLLSLVRVINMTGPHAIEDKLRFLEGAPLELLENHLRSPSKYPIPKEIDTELLNQYTYKETYDQFVWMFNLLTAASLLLLDRKELRLLAISHLLTKMLGTERAFAAKLNKKQGPPFGSFVVVPIGKANPNPDPDGSLTRNMAAMLLKTNTLMVPYTIMLYCSSELYKREQWFYETSQDPWGGLEKAAIEVICSAFDELHKAYMLWQKKKRRSGIGCYFHLQFSLESSEQNDTHGISVGHFWDDYDSVKFRERLTSALQETCYLTSDRDPVANKIESRLMRVLKDLKDPQQREVFIEWFGHDPSNTENEASFRQKVHKLYYASEPPRDDSKYKDTAYMIGVPRIISILLILFSNYFKDREDFIESSRLLFPLRKLKWWRHKYIPLR